MFLSLFFLIIAIFTISDAYRLPKTFHPENYRLKVITHLDEDGRGHRFTGKVWIAVSILKLQ